MMNTRMLLALFILLKSLTLLEEGLKSVRNALKEQIKKGMTVFRSRNFRDGEFLNNLCAQRGAMVEWLEQLGYAAENRRIM